MLSASRLTGAGFLLAAITFASSPSTADAQYWGYGYYGGVSVRAPGVGVNVGPFGGVSVRAPYTRVNVPGRAYYYGPRRVVRSGYYVTGPTYVESGVVTSGGVVTGGTVVSSTPTTSTTVTTTTAKPTPAASATFAFATEAELAAMGDATLVASISDASAAFDAQLGGLSNGAGWQTYLAVDTASLGDLAFSQKLLKRFDSVARDSQFAAISAFEEFKAIRLALRVLVDRGGVAEGAATETSTGGADVSVKVGDGVSVRVEGESLPTPNADVEVNVPGVQVERSVLTR